MCCPCDGPDGCTQLKVRLLYNIASDTRYMAQGKIDMLLIQFFQ